MGAIGTALEEPPRSILRSPIRVGNISCSKERRAQYLEASGNMRANQTENYVPANSLLESASSSLVQTMKPTQNPESDNPKP